MEVKIKKLHPEAVIPKYALDGDAGLDLTAVSMVYENNHYVYGIGLAIEIPKGYVGLIYPRSSISKKDLVLANHVPVIDSNFRGEIVLKFKPLVNPLLSSVGDTYNIGDRIAQLMIVPYPKIKFKEVEELSDSNRGTRSYGSTGN